FSGKSQSGEKAPWHDACGHDSAAEWTNTSARLVVHHRFFDGRLRPAAIDVCGQKPRERRLF
ncbi:hypothetical protein, partial [Mesorhizobium sp. M7A.F.Ca.CA.004.02.1.1]|uniref:hypothetical protein n=1 Tax=Mesorhizobium sp. M7A.F.Ca.CA.004.02.1.1 TaxID=2496690 RepID=UPI0019D1F24B